jgi:hypothetical protein
MTAGVATAKLVITPGTDYARARESIASRLAEAEEERADTERQLYELQASADTDDDSAQKEIASLSRNLVTLDVKVRSLRGAGPELDKREAAAKEAAEEARLAGVEVKLAKAVTALDKATASLADNLQMFLGALDTAKRAENKCFELGEQVHQELRNPGVVQRVRFALFAGGYNPDKFTSLDLPSGWAKRDAIADMREPRRLRKTVPSPGAMPSGPRKVAAEVLMPATK